jgi:hypothetical protein
MKVLSDAISRLELWSRVRTSPRLEALAFHAASIQGYHTLRHRVAPATPDLYTKIGFSECTPAGASHAMICRNRFDLQVADLTMSN